MYELELFADVRKGNAEGPHWDERTNTLYFVAIPEGEVHAIHEKTGAHRVYTLGQECGAAVTTARGRMIVALENGLYFLDLDSGKLTFIADPEPDKPDNRFNDAKCDPYGRLYAGTIASDAPNASLYRLDPDGALKTVQRGVTISNGLDWNPDRTLMYYIDSTPRTIDVFDYSAATGEISNRRTLARIPEELGVPDGMCVDAAGELWVAIWGGHCVRHFAPDGRLIDQIDVPVKCVSSCCFGGEKLDELYITTAGGPSEEEPHAGSVFRTRTGSVGQAPTRYNDTIREDV